MSWPKQIERTATLAWSPSTQSPVHIALGTVAGSLDASFSSSTELELYRISMEDKGNGIKLVMIDKPSTPGGQRGVDLLAKATTSARFNKLAWTNHKQGLIIGGLANGQVLIYDAKAMIEKADNSLIHDSDIHKGQVRGLDVNPVQQNLFATGAQEEVFVWDLENLKPKALAKSNKLEDVTCLAWNRQVPQILVTGSNNGYTVVNDLKVKKEVIQLVNPSGRRPVSCVVWNPDFATHLLTASDDDGTPVILSWDLRNARAPEKVLTGHSKGILTMAWCPKDSDLLLSAGKDNRILCWNPKSAEMIGEFSDTSNWTFDVQWCPRHPDIVALASFDGTIKMCSIHNNEAPTDNDPFAVTTGFTLSHTPRWLKRPLGGIFMLGGKLLLFKQGSTKITIKTVVTDREFVERARQLDSCFESDNFADYCATKVVGRVEQLKDAASDDAIWSCMKVMFERDPRHRLLELLGYKKVAANEVDESVDANPIHDESTAEAPIESNKVVDSVQSTQINSNHSNIKSNSISLINQNDSEIDRKIAKSIIIGDFESAVDNCLSQKKWSDALVLAACGGADLLARTQQQYFAVEKSSYLWLVSAIVKKDLEDIVNHVKLDDWSETVAVLCTFAKADKFGELCNLMAEKLESVNLNAAIICYLVAGNMDRVSSLWYKQCEAFSGPKSLMVQSFMEKMVVYKRAVECDKEWSDPGVFKIIIEYSQLLASQGEMELAVKYLSWADGIEESADNPLAVERERLFKAANHETVDLFKVIEFGMNGMNVDGMNNDGIKGDGYQYGQSSYAQPSNSYAQPSNSYAQPSNSYAQPSNSYAQPSNSYAQPSNSYAQPSNSFAQPSNSFAQPSNSYAQPQSNYQPQATSFTPQPSNSYSQPSSYQQPSTYQPFNSNPYYGSTYGQEYPPSRPSIPSIPRPPVPIAANPEQQQPSVPMPQMTNTPAPAIHRRVSSGYNDPPVVAKPAVAPAARPVMIGGSGARPFGYNGNQIGNQGVNQIGNQPPPNRPMMNQPMNPNQPMNQAMNSNQPMNPNQPMNQPPHQRPMIMNQRPNQPYNPNQPMNPMTNSNQPMNPMMNPNQPMNPMMNPNQPMNPNPNPIVNQNNSNQRPPFNQGNQGNQFNQFNQNQPYNPQQFPPKQGFQQQQGPVAAVNSAPQKKPEAVRKYPPGDRSHIPPKHVQIVASFTNLIKQCRERTPPQQQRILDDSDKRISTLFDALNEGTLSEPAISKLLQISSCLEKQDYMTALGLQVEVMSAFYQELGASMMGLKRCLDIAKMWPK